MISPEILRNRNLFTRFTLVPIFFSNLLFAHTQNLVGKVIIEFQADTAKIKDVSKRLCCYYYNLSVKKKNIIKYLEITGHFFDTLLKGLALKEL